MARVHRGGSLREILCAAALLLVPHLAAAAVPDDVAQSLLPDQAGWSADPDAPSHGTAADASGSLGLRIYHRGAERAVLALWFGPHADRVADMISTMPAEQFVAPLPQDRWTERGFRLWQTERDGFAYEAGIVLNYEAGHPDHSAYASITGTAMPVADALAILHSLDWERIKGLADQ